MGKLVIKHFEKTSLASGSIWEDEWTADKDYTIKYILIRRGDSSVWTKSTITIWIDGVPITRDKAPVAIFGCDMLGALPINLDLLKDHTIKWSLTNNEGVTIDVFLDLILETKE